MPDSARDLLTETLPHLPGALQARVREFLGEPVHVGDTIVLNASYPTPEERCEPSSDLGFRFVPYTAKHREYDFDKREYTGEIRTYEGQHTLYPEAGQARNYDWSALAGGIVVPINGRKYRVGIHVEESDGIPEGAVVTFTHTDEDETPHSLHDPSVGVQSLVTYFQNCIEGYREQLADREEEWDSDSIRASLLEDELHIENLESGAELRWPKGPVTLFGQPCFIQNEITARIPSGAAMHLATLDTGWGDCGNVNILFACDDDGVPCRAWFEASCA